jgi:hypothetical protein
VLAVHEPGLDVLTAFNVPAHDLGHYVPAPVGWAGAQSGPLPPVHVAEAGQVTQKLEAELLERGGVEVV